MYGLSATAEESCSPFGDLRGVGGIKNKVKNDQLGGFTFSMFQKKMGGCSHLRGK